MQKQITIKVLNEEKGIIRKAAKLLGLGHSSFCRMVSLERARELLKKNNLDVDLDIEEKIANTSDCKDS